MMRRVSSETHHLWTKKNSASCRCAYRKSRIGRRISQWHHLILIWLLQHKASCRDSTSCPWISTEAEFLLDLWITLVLSYLLGCCSVGSLEETALLDLENWRCRVSSRRQGSPSVELSINSATSLLLNLGGSTTRKEHAVFRWTDEQKLLFEGGKKGFVKTTKLDFMRR